jgi:hypothetical protein
MFETGGSMTADNFDRILEELAQRTPFQVFTVELHGDRRFEVDHPQSVLVLLMGRSNNIADSTCWNDHGVWATRRDSPQFHRPSRPPRTVARHGSSRVARLPNRNAARSLVPRRRRPAESAAHNIRSRKLLRE